mmetsp:Transcript_1623/g.4444  ORF Transcript_1623/g.4444 Transcript_1623/m.4444 type:complete len:123 (-) Transcript_1623:102-470(-)
MQRVAPVAVAVLAFLAAAADGKRAAFTVNDQVFVDGSLFSEGAKIESNIGCHEHKGTSSFKVCGCGVKVVAHLLTECEGYKQYDEQVGTCDCSTSACDEKTLTTGYSKPFEWRAASFEISAC